MAPKQNAKALKRKKEVEASKDDSDVSGSDGEGSIDGEGPLRKLKKKTKEKKWNKHRVLVFCSRGINFRARHLMMDLRNLIPHSRPDNKLDRKDKLFIINEVAEMKNCDRCVFFEMRKKKDLYMWVSNIPHGPSARFLVENVHTMDELKLAGNCLKGSRPILSFDKKFDESLHATILKKMFTEIFGTPYQHPKSKPFVDRVMTFTILENRIWVRNYQIINQNDMSLTEIGPRFVLNLIRIFDGSFGGSTLYENAHYVSPNEHRRRIRQQAAFRYLNKKNAQNELNQRLEEQKSVQEESLDDIFHTVTQADIIEARNRAK